MPSPTGYSGKRPKALVAANDAGTHQGTYNPATLYAAGNTVTYKGTIFRKTDAAAAGTTPTFGSASWTPGSRKGTQSGAALDPTATGGSDTRITLGPDEGQHASVRLAKESARTAAEA